MVDIKNYFEGGHREVDYGGPEKRIVSKAVYNLAQKIAKDILADPAAIPPGRPVHEQMAERQNRLQSEIDAAVALQPGKECEFREAIKTELLERAAQLPKRETVKQRLAVDLPPNDKADDTLSLEQLQARALDNILKRNDALAANDKTIKTTDQLADMMEYKVKEAAEYMQKVPQLSEPDSEPERKKLARETQENIQKVFNQQLALTAAANPEMKVWDYFEELEDKAKKRRDAAVGTDSREMYSGLAEGLNKTLFEMEKKGDKPLTLGGALANEALGYLSTPIEFMTRPFHHLSNSILEKRHHAGTMVVGAAVVGGAVGVSTLPVTLPLVAAGLGIAAAYKGMEHIFGKMVDSVKEKAGARFVDGVAATSIAEATTYRNAGNADLDADITKKSSWRDTSKNKDGRKVGMAI